MNILLQISISIILVYGFLSLIAWLLMTNNILIWRSGNYSIPFGVTDGKQYKKELKNPRIRYWRCENLDFNDQLWVILLHGWGRNAARMITRAQIYWDQGYSLIFVDARCHGQSQYTRITTAILYSQDTRRIIEKEGIDNPIIHGLSFGAVASSIYVSKYPVKAYVAEALPSNYPEMFYDFLAKLRFPKFLFGWVPWLIMRYDFPWDEMAPSNVIQKLNAPVFLIHGENDSLFQIEKHFIPNSHGLASKLNGSKSWIVPDSLHSKMAQHPQYKNKLKTFLSQFS
ncbi:MAG: alpha/beta hydrolase [Candidatus Kariarchaeaceae archaeon]|jgi:pimeloyl-ACP methyl ester carboxylesterase